MALDDIPARNDGGVTRAQCVRDRVALLVDVHVRHVVRRHRIAALLEVLRPLLAAPARRTLIESRLLRWRDGQPEAGTHAADGVATSRNAQPITARDHRSSDQGTRTARTTRETSPG